MSRRKDDGALVDMVASFAELPLWVAPFGALLAFLGLQFGVPALMPKGTTGLAVSTLAVMSAPWLAAAILLSGVFGAVKRLVGRAGDQRILSHAISIESIRALNWSDFERMLAGAYRQMGYEVTPTQRGADGGVDHILRKQGQSTYLQAKHWKARRVGVDKVRELHGVAVADGVATSILVTSGSFTEEARSFAGRTGITLVDGTGLMALVRPLLVGELPAKELPAEAASSATCPRCGAAMVVRQSRRGQNAGSSFRGCSRYPACRGTLQLAA